jgi:hypothetical protein
MAVNVLTTYLGMFSCLECILLEYVGSPCFVSLFPLYFECASSLFLLLRLSGPFLVY